MKTGLLIIDIQKDYFPGGRCELHNSVEACGKTKILLEHFRSKKRLVVYIKHISTMAGATFFLPGTAGIEIADAIAPVGNEEIIVKHFPNSFRETTLDDYLKKNEIGKLVIAGMMTHMCVDTTVRAAYDLGYECILAGDCCATKNLSFNGKEISAEDVGNAFLAAINSRFAKVITAEEIITEM